MTKREGRYSQKKTLPMDAHGWIDAILYKPKKALQFDLVMLKDDLDNTQCGWWTGQEWDYANIRLRGKILKWRFIESRERISND